MKDDEGGTFLGRWSRRKTAARAGKPLEEPLPAAAAQVPDRGAPRPGADADAGTTATRGPERTGAVAGAPVEGPPPDLPALDSLRGLESEYRDFLRPEVDEGTRRAALKRLFADPHFNRMDGLDVYIDDYTQPDPIPTAMLRNLQHAKDMLFGDEERRPEAGDAQPTADQVPDVTSGTHTDRVALQETEAGPTTEPPSSARSDRTEANDPECPDSSQVLGSSSDPARSG
ncbi:MAG: DUF3306 domain-containing protein [Burkholderiales bacterium]|nr:DUF3306 domain-containing protein [Burkholderiales bacterium]